MAGKGSQRLYFDVGNQKKGGKEIRKKVTVHLQFTISPYLHIYVRAGFSFFTSVS